jgi:hypothetical protein
MDTKMVPDQTTAIRALVPLGSKDHDLDQSDRRRDDLARARCAGQQLSLSTFGQSVTRDTLDVFGSPNLPTETHTRPGSRKFLASSTLFATLLSAPHVGAVMRLRALSSPLNSSHARRSPPKAND